MRRHRRISPHLLATAGARAIQKVAGSSSAQAAHLESAAVTTAAPDATRPALALPDASQPCTFALVPFPMKRRPQLECPLMAQSATWTTDEVSPRMPSSVLRTMTQRATFRIPFSTAMRPNFCCCCCCWWWCCGGVMPAWRGRSPGAHRRQLPGAAPCRLSSPPGRPGLGAMYAPRPRRCQRRSTL